MKRSGFAAEFPGLFGKLNPLLWKHLRIWADALCRSVSRAGMSFNDLSGLASVVGAEDGALDNDLRLRDETDILAALGAQLRVAAASATEAQRRMRDTSGAGPTSRKPLPRPKLSPRGASSGL